MWRFGGAASGGPMIQNYITCPGHERAWTLICSAQAFLEATPQLNIEGL